MRTVSSRSHTDPPKRSLLGARRLESQTTPQQVSDPTYASLLIDFTGCTRRAARRLRLLSQRECSRLPPRGVQSIQVDHKLAPKMTEIALNRREIDQVSQASRQWVSNGSVPASPAYHQQGCNGTEPWMGPRGNCSSSDLCGGKEGFNLGEFDVVTCDLDPQRVLLRAQAGKLGVPLGYAR